MLKICDAVTNLDWEKIKHFRQYYFFDKAGIQDPYQWTFGHEEHKHFLLKENEEIVGYAHIQLWPNNRAAIRIIVIDEPQRNKGYGSQLLSLCEQYLKERGYTSIHAESNPAALAFYKRHGYIEMPFNDPENHESDASDIPVGKKI